MTIEEERTELILEQTEPDQSSDISEGVESAVTWAGKPRGVEASLAGLVEQGRVLISQVNIHPVWSVPRGGLGGHHGGSGGERRDGGGRQWDGEEVTGREAEVLLVARLNTSRGERDSW